MLRWLIENDRVRLGVTVVGALDNNVYFVVCPQTGEAVIVDAADDAPSLIEAVSGLVPVAILTTHGHWDHVGAVEAVSGDLGIPFLIHPADSRLAGRTPERPLFDGEVIQVGTLELTAIHTPGHTPGSVCFSGPDLLLTGDTLFPGGPGSTRGPGASFDEIMNSLVNRLFAFPDPTPFYPGHGAPSTIGEERPFLEEWRARGW